jgi:SAM-dependent methyltransferase
MSDPGAVRAHWEELARQHGVELGATTKSPTIKRLEIEALARTLDRIAIPPEGRVLEAGCGNGRNCLELAARFPRVRFTGFDYIPEMVDAARAAHAALAAGNATFVVGDVRDPSSIQGLEAPFDAIFTDRCLINLASHEEQLEAIDALAELVRPGGWLLLIENTLQGYARQNAARESLGLPAREPPWHNLFFNEDRLSAHLEERLELIGVEDFASLHDLLLYVLVPATSGGAIDYDHPVVVAATELLLRHEPARSTGAFGQNRLFLVRCPG